jgi:Lysyl oxidase
VLKASQPRTPQPSRRLLLLVLVTTLLAGAALVGGRHASALTDPRPDLVAQFPDQPYATQKAPVYLDAYTEPGTLLYRFDAVLFNKGGTLDVYRDATTGHVFQAIWAGGLPSVAPDPNSPPPAGTPGLTTEDITAKGAAFQYVTGPDHNHFHFENVAKYSLLVPGLGAFSSAKVGFCFGDDYGTPAVSYFPYPYTGPGMSWCAVGHPEATFFREGISPGAGDLYNSQVQYQWIDVTGLRAGNYSIRGEVNPNHVIDESSYANNVTTLPRVVAGVVGHGVALSRAVKSKFTLHASIIAPQIPARQSPNCYPRSASMTCLVTDLNNGKLRFKLASTPCFGHVRLRTTGATTATATYVPGSQAPSIDGFGFVATDARALTSVPAYVRIGKARASGAPQACVLGATAGVDRRVRVAFITTGGTPPGTHWALYVNSHLDPTSKVGKNTAVTPVLQSGKTGFWLELVRGSAPLRPRVQSREVYVDVPALLKATG